MVEAVHFLHRYLRHLAQKKAQGDLQRVMREFAKTAKLYSVKIAASIKLQASSHDHRRPPQFCPPFLSRYCAFIS